MAEGSSATNQLPAEARAAPDESTALTRFAFRELGAAVGGIGVTHKGIAGRVFGALGPGGRIVQRIHDSITSGTYRALEGSYRAVGRGAAAAQRAIGGLPSSPISTRPGGATLIGAINGLVGDALEREGSELHQPMSVRVGGREVATAKPALRGAFPDAAPRLVIFLHGLMETEFGWSLGAGTGGETYGTRLGRELGCTPVYVRYNTGRHISENGSSLAQLLEQLVAEWPVKVEEISLIGHSMGGLVARSACHRGSEQRASWVELVGHVISLGTPHMGAPLAQGVHYAAAALDKLPETRAMAGLLRRRSAGIRDLRHGSLVDQDWQGRDPDVLRAAVCKEVPLLEGATHCFVAATLTRSPRHPLGRLLGDTLVLVPSASGRSRTRRIPFRDEDGAHVGGAHHIALLNHPLVYERLREWLTTPRLMPAAGD